MLSCNLFILIIVLRIAKEYHEYFSLLHFLYITFFSEKWLTFNVFSPS
jgi:hypothetical protein